MTTTAPPPSGAPDRYQQGVQLLTEIHGQQTAREILDAFDDLYPPFGRYVLEAGFADVYARPGLTVKQWELINVAVVVSLGDTAPQLTTHIKAAARNGATPLEIFETIFHVALYAGQPRAVNALAVARTVLELPVPTAQEEGGDKRPI